MINERISEELIKLSQRTDIPTDVRLELVFLADELSDSPILEENKNITI